VDEVDVAGYLARLGLEHPGPPSVAGLVRLHRAHLERVPYENLEIQLGRRTSVDPYESVTRVLRGRGGYCFHLNGAFSALLRALGYDVRWHVGGVQPNGVAGPPGAVASHLALTVHGLPSPACQDGSWLVDVGLGDGPYEPLPLRAGEFRQGPFRYRLERSAVVPGGWRLVHDPAGGFTGMDFAWPVAQPAAFAASHAHLSTSPESGFVRGAVAKRRHASGSDALGGCLLTRLDAAGRRETVIDTARDWYAVLADVFGLTLEDVGPSERAALWRRVRTAFEAWLADGPSPCPVPSPRPGPRPRSDRGRLL
jgi:arylamine N-acetyltransferase